MEGTKPAAVQDILVLGLGNTLLADDGVGVHVVRQLERDPAKPPWVRSMDGGTLGFRLTHALAGADAVLLIDAAQLGEAPGTIRLLGEDELTAHVRRTGPVSAHEAGLAYLLALARMEGVSPKRLALLGIQPRIIGWGEALSDTVAASVDAACRLAVDTVLAWQTSI